MPELMLLALEGRMRTVVRTIGALGVLSPALFIAGILAHSPPLVVAGGVLLLVNDVLAVLVGALNPLFPLVLAVVLALLVHPWWLGVFWASAVFAVIDIPASLRQLSRPQEVVDSAVAAMEDSSEF